MRPRNIILFGIGFIFIILSIFHIYQAQQGLDVIHLRTTDPPTTIITPSGAAPGSRPTVLIAHGFAGSSQLMRGFAFTLAHAGYTTVSWDFEGHGSNPNPLVSSGESSDLIKDAVSALAYASDTGIVDTQRVAILGHSMGSGVALDYGVTYPGTMSTIAISPVPQPVTSELPHNLLLMGGSLEPQFVANAEKILSDAGGANNNLAGGSARQLTIIPGVEHISILFLPLSHSTALGWLDATFGSQPGAVTYTDNRILWYLIGILGFIFTANAGINTLPSFSQENKSRPISIRLIAMIAGALAATLILWLIGRAGIALNQVFGVLVGGYLLIWFGVAGVAGLLILRPHIYLPRLNELFKGLIVFAGLWLGVGLLGNFIWLPWLLIPQRLVLWIPGAILLTPWFFTVAEASKSAKIFGQAGWWLVQVLSIIAGFFLALTLDPGLGFIFLILPLIPVILAFHMLSISSRHGSWAFTLPGAMFTAWLLLAVFPIQ